MIILFEVKNKFLNQLKHETAKFCITVYCFSILLSGCVTTPKQELPPPPPPPPVQQVFCPDGSMVPDYDYCPAEPTIYPPISTNEAKPKCLKKGNCTSVDVLFGATRQIDWNIAPEVDGTQSEGTSAFLETMTTDPDNLELGVMRVTVPHLTDREDLTILRPREERGFWIFKKRAEILDSSEHYTLFEYEKLDELTFKNSLAEKNSAFVYIHGFKEDAEIAAFKAAQIAVKGNYSGTPTIFTWPSLEKTTPSEYTKARKNARQSASRLARFIELVSSEIESQNVHIIAHSMGNHILLESMKHLNTSETEKYPLGEVMLAAPDIAGSAYLNFVSNNKVHFGGITLYTSQQDKTLEFSQQVCRLRRFKLEELGVLSLEQQSEYNTLDCHTRAGYSKANNGSPLIIDGADTIDASKVDESRAFLNIASWHSYPFTDNKLLQDMSYIMAGQRSFPSYRRPNLECLTESGAPCKTPFSPSQKHYFSFK